MHSWHEFLDMGGYAVYVWPAYAVGFVVIAGSGWNARRGLQQALRRARRRAQEVKR